MGIIRFIKNWTLPISMIAGVVGYFVYVNIPFLKPTYQFVNAAIGIIQPTLIFLMLFLTFCKIEPRDLHFCKWHVWLLLIQILSFSLLVLIHLFVPDEECRIILEGAMICLICPTATAGAVITAKLGGSAANLTTYTILINIAVAVLIPTMVPLVNPHPELSMFSSFLLIIAKVFPLLMFPLIAAILVRYLFPPLHRLLCRWTDLSFYLWAVALALAIAVTVRIIVHSEVSVFVQIMLAAVSFVACVLQFYLGKRIGSRYSDRISAGQSLGQKNTVLAIWLGYTFFSPITAVVGGFYSIWHNVINSYQLYKARKA